MQKIAVVSVASALSILLQPPIHASEAQPARAANAFGDFVGVNTHLGYSDTTYGDYEGFLKPRLLELGVRNIRDGTFSDELLRGMAKAYKYELLDLKPDPGFTDMERHFGLVRTNGVPKPSFYALKNLLHLLADPGQPEHENDGRTRKMVRHGGIARRLYRRSYILTPR
jgi:hypothetical protein